MPQPNQVKVALEGPHGEIETLWATVVAPNQYELDNLPWCAYGVSAGDVIEARPDAAGQLRMTRIVRKSGNRTIRVILAVTSGGQPTFESQQMLSGILERGCSYEGRNKLLFAVNIPAPVNLAGIAQYLTDSGFRWEYADPTFNDLFPGEQGESDPADA